MVGIIHQNTGGRWEGELLDRLISGPFNKLVMACKVGSGVNDCDVVCIYDKYTGPTNLRLGGLDLSVYSANRFSLLCRNRDPFASDVVVAGDVLYEEDKAHDCFRMALGAPVGWDVVRFLASQGAQGYVHAVYLFESQISTDACSSMALREFWDGIGYVLSSMVSARCYADDATFGPLSLNCLLEYFSQDEKGLWAFARANRSSKGCESASEALCALEKLYFLSVA